MNNFDIRNNISFKAQLGPKLNKTIQKERNYDSLKIKKFERMFSDIFEEILDTNTIIDIDKNKNWILSHPIFPNIKFCQKNTIGKMKTLSQNLLMECPKVLASAESHLYRVIISNVVNAEGKFDKLYQLSEKFLSPKSKNKFLEEISIAQRIRKENPCSKLNINEFDPMLNKILLEDIQNPNSELYKLKESLLSSK